MLILRFEAIWAITSSTKSMLLTFNFSSYLRLPLIFNYKLLIVAAFITVSFKNLYCYRGLLSYIFWLLYVKICSFTGIFLISNTFCLISLTSIFSFASINILALKSNNISKFSMPGGRRTRCRVDYFWIL